jgi:hypothetical protein
LKHYPELDDLLGRSAARLLMDIKEAQDRLDILRAMPFEDGMRAITLAYEAQDVRAYIERLDRALAIAVGEILR